MWCVLEAPNGSRLMTSDLSPGIIEKNENGAQRERRFNFSCCLSSSARLLHCTNFFFSSLLLCCRLDSKELWLSSNNLSRERGRMEHEEENSMFSFLFSSPFFIDTHFFSSFFIEIIPFSAYARLLLLALLCCVPFFITRKWWN